MVLQFLGNSSQSKVNLTKKCFNFCNYIIRLSLCLIRCLRKRKVFITSRAHCRIWYYYLAIIVWPHWIIPSEICRILHILRKTREKNELFSFFSVTFGEFSEHVLQLLRRRSENWTNVPASTIITNNNNSSIRVNMCKIIYLNSGEGYEDTVDHPSYAHNLSSCEIKAWKTFRPEQISATSDKARTVWRRRCSRRGRIGYQIKNYWVILQSKATCK